MSSQRRPDFVVITPLEEEREALLALLPGFRRLPPDEQDIRIYYEAEVPISDHNGARASYQIIVVSPIGMGRLEAANVTSDSIRRFRPRYVILCGIAGAVAADASLGDILIADQFIDYELQKLTNDQSQIRYQTFRADPRLLGAAQHLRGWVNYIKIARPLPAIPRRHFGPIASGDKVIANRQILEQYVHDWPKMIGVEMEGSGVASAAFQAVDKPGVLMIRGVSDFADKNKSTDEVAKWREYACGVASAYTIALLHSVPVPAIKPQLAASADVQRQSKADGLQLSEDARWLFMEKPRYWEYRLISQVLSDELIKSEVIYHDYKYGLNDKAPEYIHAYELIQKVQAAFEEAVALMAKLQRLTFELLPEALGPDGTPGDAFAIAQITKRIGDIYKQAIEWSLQWNHYISDEDCNELISLLRAYTSGIINGIRKFNIDLNSTISTIMDSPEGSGQREFVVNLSIEMPDNPGDKIAQQTHRITQRLIAESLKS